MKLYKFLITTGLFVILFFGLSPQSVKAIYPCGEVSRIGNDAIFFGDGPSAEVIKAKNQTVKINVAGEEGCEGKKAIFKIYTAGQSKIVTDASGTLVRGLKTGVYGIYLFSIDWRINIDNGQYRAKLSSVQDARGGGAGTKFTSNVLKIENAQDCSLSKVFANPRNIKFGQKTNLIVEATGKCDNWGVSINIYNETRKRTEASLNEKKFSSGDHTLTFEWGPTENFYTPSVKGQENIDNYHFISNLGNQKLQSQQFFVTFIGEESSGFGNAPLKTSFKLTPPPGLPTSIEEFVGDIIDFIFNISIPIAVILIIVSGIIMLTSAGNMTRVGKARTILWYTVLGLAIIFIGKGFITLVTSILGGR